MSLLKEDNGNYSMTRVLSLTITITALITGVLMVITDSLTTAGTTLVLGELGLAVGTKTVSKKLEQDMGEM